jgi:hypothetical protein
LDAGAEAAFTPRSEVREIIEPPATDSSVASPLQPPGVQGGVPMIQRRTFPTDYPGCEVHVVTEQMAAGDWAVVATIQQTVEDATRTIDLPVPSQRFASEAEARDYGLAQAMRWIERNTPSAERKSA